MGHLSYEDSKKRVVFGLLLLGAVTLVEVGFSLAGKGHIFKGLEDIGWLAYVIGLILVILSLYKAYFIVFEFMHMKYEVRSLALTVLLPTLLLVWAVIAFFQEGDSWKDRRQQIEEFNEEEVEEESGETQSLRQDEIYRLEIES